MPTSLPAGVTTTQYSAALAACRSDLPTFGGGGGFNSTALVAYRDCLVAHGYTPPAFGRPGTTTPTTTAGETTTTVAAATRQAAEAACVALLPKRTGSTSSTTVAG